MGSIAIVGVGHDPHSPLDEATLRRLRGFDRVVVSSSDAVLREQLAQASIDTMALTDMGLAPDAPVERVIEGLAVLAEQGDLAYVTSSYPFLRPRMLSGLLARTRASIDVFPMPAPLQAILMAFDIDLTADLDIVDAQSLAPSIEQRGSHLIITNIHNKLVSKRVAAKLAEIYSADHEVVFAGCNDGAGFELSLHTVASLASAPACEDAALYVPPSRILPPQGFDEFARLIAVLRGPDGCPWDKAQDHMSLRRHMIEEAYEAIAAIESGDDNELADELGDVLLQVLLHAQIAADEGRFDIGTVVARISEKIRRRHPHIFGDATADTPEQVITNWDAIKRTEKSDAGLLDSIPRSLPALMLAQKISKRAVSVGFEWETLDDIWDKVHEEIDELKATEPGSPEAADEIGDLLFTVVNLARKQGIDAEEALRGTCDKFSRRWRSMESDAAAQGQDIAEFGIDGLEQLWGQAKTEESREASRTHSGDDSAQEKGTPR